MPINAELSITDFSIGSVPLSTTAIISVIAEAVRLLCPRCMHTRTPCFSWDSMDSNVRGRNLAEAVANLA
jgi:hypothetical protein